MTSVTDTGTLAGPELPAGVLPDGESWHPQTLALWQELRRSPIMQGEPGLTWAYMVDTVVLHHMMWQHQEHRFAPELRLRLAKVAATPEDRQRLKIRVTQPVDTTEPAPGVANIAARRARLTEQSD